MRYVLALYVLVLAGGLLFSSMDGAVDVLVTATVAVIAFAVVRAIRRRR